MASRKQFLADGRFTTELAKPRLIVFGALALIGVIALLLVVLNLEGIREWASTAEGPRRRNNPGMVITGMFLIPALWTVIFGGIGWHYRFTVVTQDGQRLKGGETRRFPAQDGIVERIHQDFASQDPARYQPWLDAKSDGPVLLVVFTAERGARYVSVESDKRGGPLLPLVELPPVAAPATA